MLGAGLLGSLLAVVAGCARPPPSLSVAAPGIDRADREYLVDLPDDLLGNERLLVQLHTLDQRLEGPAVVEELMAAFPDGGASVERVFDTLPYVSVQVRDQASLAHLMEAPGVVRVFRDKAHQHHLTQSLSFIGQPTAAAGGARGAGVSVAVLDTGLDWRQPAFGTCPAPGAAGCRVAFVADFAPDDGNVDDNGHGTNVAGIVVGTAPDAKVIGLDVFRGASAFSSDIIAAMDWVVAHRAEHRIVAINLSLGSGGNTTACGNDVFSAAIRTARAAGVLTVASSGNDGFTNRIASPACVPEAVSVGAVYDTTMAGRVTYSACVDTVIARDRTTCFSNTASFLTVLAPGAFIEAAGISMTGTSQAAPHVAGSIAVVAAAFPGTADSVLDRLLGSGAVVADARTGVAFPRIDLAAATARPAAPTSCPLSLSTANVSFGNVGGSGTITVTTPAQCPWTMTSSAPWLTLGGGSGSGPATVAFTVGVNTGAPRTTTVAAGSATTQVAQTADTTPPTGTIALVDIGTVTRTRTVTLALAASDPSGVSQMCVSNTTSCTTFVPFATRLPWTLAPSGTTATVRAWFKDAAGNRSTVTAIVTVGFDATAPTNGTVTAAAGNARVTLSWTGFADGGSGLQGTVLVSGPTAPATCSTGTVLARGTATTFVHTGLTNGTAVGYRVCGVDVAGNISTGVTATARPVPETAPPTGTVVIAGAPGPVNSSTVLLTLSARDASAVTQMCVSNRSTCTAFTPFLTTTSWTLASGSGLRTVSVWFRDTWGNTSTSPATATITTDVTLPRDGSALATAGNARLSLAWSGFSDVGSGLAAMRVAYLQTTAPATCATGTQLALAATATSTVVSGLANGTRYGLRVCAIDAAGNSSRGVVVTGMPVAEQDAPTAGRVVINAGATLSKTSAVQLGLSATDATAVAQMCVSNTASCTAWVTFATTKTWTLASGSGPRTVNVWFRDTWGNTTAAPVSATIAVDNALPTGGVLTATAGPRSVNLSWSGFSDVGTGVVSYKLVSGATAPATCATGTVLSTGSATSFSHTGLTASVRVGYRVCAVDGAGNVSAGVTALATPTP